MNDPDLAKIIGKSLAVPGSFLIIWMGAKLWGIVKKFGKKGIEVDKHSPTQQKDNTLPAKSDAAAQATFGKAVNIFGILLLLGFGIAIGVSFIGTNQQPGQQAATVPKTTVQPTTPQAATATPQTSQPTTDLNMLTKAAEQGDSHSQVKLGNMYLGGTGVPQDDKQAVTWFRKSAEQGDPLGQFALGFVYRGGRGVPQDDKQAIIWFRKSAEQGFGPGQFYLGRMYRDGQDYLTAYAWLSLAASEGVEDAAKHRDSAAYGFTPAQRSKAQALAAELQAKIDKQKK